MLRILLLISAMAFFLLLMLIGVAAQDINSLKEGVVRIKNNKSGELGTGFIVKIDKDLLYVVTSSHVVRGDQNPGVSLYNRPQQDPLPARLVYREDDSQKGLALLIIKLNNAEMVSGLTALSFGNSAQLNGGEFVKIIGFPDGTSFWTVSSGTVSRVEGNNLVFSGPIRGGNSGGPVILSNGQVVGMVTDTIESQITSYAAKSEIIVSYVNGLSPNLISINTSVNGTAPSLLNNDLCQVLIQMVDAGRNDFYQIVGNPTSSTGVFESKIKIPNSYSNQLTPGERVSSFMFSANDRNKLESEYYSLVSKIRFCFSKWEQREIRKGKTIDGTATRFYMLRENKKSVVLVISYNLTPTGCCYYLWLSINTAKYYKDRW